MIKVSESFAYWLKYQVRKSNQNKVKMFKYSDVYTRLFNLLKIVEF